MTQVATATPLPVHLSVLHLDPAHRDVSAEVRNIHRLHARVQTVFDGIPHPDGARVLWALPRPTTLVLQGPAPVTPHDLPPGYATGGTARTITAPAPGARVKLSLIANPTSQHHHDGRTPLPAGARNAWLARKLEPAIALDPHRTSGRELPAARGTRTGGQAIHLARHAYHAEGTVADQVMLARLLLAGVGHGKGYGCGLLIATQVPA